MTQEAFSSCKATYPLPVVRTCFLSLEPGAWAGRGEACTPSRAHGRGLLSARTDSGGSSEEVVVAGSSASQLGTLPPL